MRHLLAVPLFLLLCSACDREVVAPPTQERPARITLAYVYLSGSINIKEDPFIGPLTLTCPSGSARTTSQDVWAGNYSFFLRLEQKQAAAAEDCRLDVGEPAILVRTLTLTTSPRPDSVVYNSLRIIVAPDTPQAARMQLPLGEISASASHTCAISSSGKLYCWGANNTAQLGVGSHVSVLLSALVDVPAAKQVVAPRGCALSRVQQTYCWGDYFGTRAPSPLDAPAFDRIAGNGDSGCGRTASGNLFCWGNYLAGNVYKTPTMRSDVDHVRDVALGSYHACAIGADAGVHCWGSNSWGQLGVSPDIVRDTNIAIHTLAGLTLTSITAGGRFTCGLNAAGAAYCWGRNDRGQLGSGNATTPCFDQYNYAAPCAGTNFSPVSVVGGIKFRMLSAGGEHVCGISLDDKLYCWGAFSDGQLGLGASVTHDMVAPTEVRATGAVPGFATVSAGEKHTCAIGLDGLAYCWGNNDSGQLGIGTKERQLTPALVWGQQ